MAEIHDKENISPRRSSRSPHKLSFESPAKGTRKSRSNSIGPGSEARSPHKTKSPAKDRRKSSFVPVVKSILPSKEDEAKRREARRKSLANRRVSFAPEATLHTWDVIEYMREATTSSTGSENSRHQGQLPDNQELDDDETVPATPEDQSRIQQKRRRRSSVIPPLNFNDPDDAYSSSPVSGSSPASEDSEDVGSDDIDEEDEEDEGSTMSLVSADNTANLTIQSNISNAQSDSSAQLTARLEQAASVAGTRGPFYDEFGYVEEEQAAEEPLYQQQDRSWDEQQSMLTPMAKNLIALQGQENVNPFSPAFRAHAASGRPSTIPEEEEDVSMEMTRAVGGINNLREDESESFGEEMSMDFTQAGGRIYEPSPAENAMKRRRSTTEAGSPMTTNSNTNDLGRTAKRRRAANERMSLGDGTMEFTSAFGSIRAPQQLDECLDATMEFTAAIGNIVKSQSPIKVSRRQSVRRRRSSVQSVQSVDQSMDFTVAVGTIKQTSASPAKSLADDSNEDISMELTVNLGTVNEEEKIQSRPATPRHFSSPLREEQPTTPNHEGHFKDAATETSAKKLLTPLFQKEVKSPAPVTPVGSTKQSPVKSAQKSARKEEASLSMSPNRTPLKLPPPKNADAQTPTFLPQESLYPELPEPKSALKLTPSPRRAIRSARTSPSKVAKSEQTPKGVSPRASKSERPTEAQEMPSPVKFTPKKEPTVPAPNILDSIRTMATPRKESNATPLKRLKEMTPKKTPLRTPSSKMRTPRAIPTPRVQFEAVAEEPIKVVDDGSRQLTEDLKRSLEYAVKPSAPVTLNAFLDLAGVKFMDLTATKRRYTVAPTPSKSSANHSRDSEVSSFEDSVAAGACIVPELELYQHSCRELKRYMSEGKTFLKQLEAEVAANPPPFVSLYMAASPAERESWDRLVVDAKTRARHHSKEIWYGWRSQLLQGLQDGLRGIERGLDADAAELRRRRQHVDAILPEALREQEALEKELAMLQDMAAQSSTEDKESLQAARSELVELDATVIEQQDMLAQLRLELEEQEREAEFLIDSRSEATAAIEELNRVKEASRAISKEELASYQASVSSLKKRTGWAITAATASSLTMTYRSSLQLYFNPSSFLPSDTAKFPSRRPQSSSPISLTYIADSPVTTEKRFFLQLLRAQLHMLDPSGVPARALLSFLSSGWDTALAVADSVQRLALEQPVSVSILSDETLAIHASLLLPAAKTRVTLGFEVQASVAEDGPEMRVETGVVSTGRVVYGEAYKEDKMAEFLGQRVGKAMQGAEAAVRELRARLERTGKKA